MKDKKILVCGIMRLWAGCTSLADGLFKYYSIKTIFFYRHLKDFYMQKGEFDHKTYYAPGNSLLNLIYFVKILIKERPKHVEFYHHCDEKILIIQILLTRLFLVPVIVVCTGGEILYWEKHSRIKRFSVRFSFFMARAIILKELYMQKYIQENRIGKLEKTYFIHNAIDYTDKKKDSKDMNVLFINSFKTWRNIDLIIKAAPIVLEFYPDIIFYIVGMTGRVNEKELIVLRDNLELNANVQILPFTDKKHEFFNKSSIFLLPADVVFLNNSLLEAMSFGLVPIVSNVEGAERIIQNELNGFLVNRNEESIANAILALLRNRELYERMSGNAIKSVKNNFSEKSRSDKLINIYCEKVWK